MEVTCMPARVSSVKERPALEKQFSPRSTQMVPLVLPGISGPAGTSGRQDRAYRPARRRPRAHSDSQTVTSSSIQMNTLYTVNAHNAYGRMPS